MCRECFEEIRNWGMEEPKPLPPRPVNIDYKECWCDLKEVLIDCILDNPQNETDYRINILTRYIE